MTIHSSGLIALTSLNSITHRVTSPSGHKTIFVGHMTSGSYPTSTRLRGVPSYVDQSVPGGRRARIWDRNLLGGQNVSHE